MSNASSSRVIDVINFMAAHPTEAFTLSELEERLSLSHGSAHRVLRALVDARYLSRHPKHKTYSLGMALVAIGQAALAKHHAVDIARRELLKLAEQLKLQCLATVVVDDEMLFVVKEGIAQTREGLIRVGERRPFIPPLFLSHVAWGGPKVIASYLAKAPFEISDDLHAYLLQSMQVIRQRGYSMAANGPGFTALRNIVNEHVDNYREREYWQQMQQLIGRLSNCEIQLLNLDDPSVEALGYISAPVFSPNGEVVLEMSLTGIPPRLNKTEVDVYIERLLAAAAIVTNETHGCVPRA